MFLRAAGGLAARRPPYRYDLMRVIPAGEGLRLLDEQMFREVARQEQVPGAVRPFERRLAKLETDADTPARVHLRVRVGGTSVDILLPVLQLGSDALGRLFHVGTLN